MEACNSVPLGYKVIIKKLDINDLKKSVIEVPDEYYEKEYWKQNKGVVVSLGDLAFEGFKNSPKVGDLVLFNAPTANKFMDHDTKTEFHICNDKEIGAILKSDYKQEEERHG